MPLTGSRTADLPSAHCPLPVPASVRDRTAEDYAAKGHCVCMSKKRILFLMSSMFIGGAERSLLGLLEAFDYDKYEVDLFLYRHEGEFMPYIPEQVNLLPANSKYATFDVPIVSLLKSKNWVFGVARIWGKVWLGFKKLCNPQMFGVNAEMQYTSRCLLPLLPKIPGHYDAAALFIGVPDVLLSKVDADKKITWNHTDYTVLGPDKAYDRRLFAQLDYIASVSDRCTEQFLSVYPEFSDKAVTVQNLLSKDLLLKQAAEPVTDLVRRDGEAVLLSVGRFCEAKNFDTVPSICKALLNRGCSARWYLIGYGGGEALIRQRIAEAGMEDHVIILGKKDNPYPYMAACDLYVQPSRYEGKCVAVIEAQVLAKPVVITNYATSANQLTDGVDGVIVPMDVEGCADGIAALLRDPDKQQLLSENTKKRDYTNRAELDKLLGLLGL